MVIPDYDPDAHAREIAAKAEDALWKEAEMSEAAYRLAINERFAEIERRIATIRFEVANSAELTKEIRDILISFKTIGKLAKWLTAIGAFGAMAWHAAKEVWKRIGE